MTTPPLLLLSLLLLLCGDALGFVAPGASTTTTTSSSSNENDILVRVRRNNSIPAAAATTTTTTTVKMMNLGLGDYSIELEKPFGMILEEREREGSSGSGGGGGVMVESVLKDEESAGSAWKTGRIAPGDVLLAIDGVDVSRSDFDTVMELLTATSGGGGGSGSAAATKTAATTQLVLGDGLGRFDMPPNVLKRLETPGDAMMVDAVVRQAVREIRRDGRLGDLLRVEVIIGAGILIQNQRGNSSAGQSQQQKRGMVRFFAIFSTDGVSTYSCNVSATGIRSSSNDDGDNETIRIVSLSCAKDEGLGRTYDLIQETSETQ
eukprot:jgi/Psemu1/10338/gm1.10338_g